MRALRIIGYLIGAVWSSPLTLIGLLLALVYWPRSVRWSDGCLEFIGHRVWGVQNGAQTHGIAVWYTSKEARSNCPLRVHERVHVLQGLIGGVFYGLAYVGHFLVLYLRGAGDELGPRWYRAYWEICFERQARRITDEYLAGKRPEQWGGGR